MDELSKLGRKYGTDKIGKHNYLPVYYEMFKDRKNEVKKVLEIGVGEGAGLRMFRDFFPNAMIYGAEIDKERIFEEDRIKVFECDQGQEDNLIDLINATGEDLDLVIDDGSHNPNDQIFTCEFLLPALNKGVIYVIEDIANDWVHLDLKKRFSYLSVKLKKVGKRYDDRLVIIKKE